MQGWQSKMGDKESSPSFKNSLAQTHFEEDWVRKKFKCGFLSNAKNLLSLASLVPVNSWVP